jgi:hypothetical protein
MRRISYIGLTIIGFGDVAYTQSLSVRVPQSVREQVESQTRGTRCTVFFPLEISSNDAPRSASTNASVSVESSGGYRIDYGASEIGRFDGWFHIGAYPLNILGPGEAPLAGGTVVVLVGAIVGRFTQGTDSPHPFPSSLSWVFRGCVYEISVDVHAERRRARAQLVRLARSALRVPLRRPASIRSSDVR